jgi:DNA helicase II / ATP-dependent DNA helicase PcrA
MDEYNLNVLTGDILFDHRFERIFFSSYLFALYRWGEAEYEDAEDPFPRGRIPFLTIHQAKGLEFPVVVLGNPGKIERLQQIEKIVHPILDASREKEPMDRMAKFDVMRMFYVALSRAKNLLVIARYQGGQVHPAFKDLINDEFPHISDFNVSSLPEPEGKKDELPKNYSYTSDYLLFKRCPRQYMFFRKYQFAPARTQTMFFGNLVHQTIEDLHQHLIAQKEAQHA